MFYEYETIFFSFMHQCIIYIFLVEIVIVQHHFKYAGFVHFKY